MKSESLYSSIRNSALKNSMMKKRIQSFTEYTTSSETKEEFINRQKMYDKLYKNTYSIQESQKNKMNQIQSNLVNQIQQKILDKKEILSNYYILKDRKLEQTQKSVEIIAQFFRNQKKQIQIKQQPFKQQKEQQYNLIMILVIVLPILCIITVWAQFS